MKPFRFSIATILGVVAISAVGLMGLREGKPVWASLAFCLALAFLLGATLKAAIGPASSRPGAIGFALFGWVYMVTVFGPWGKLDMPPMPQSWAVNAILDRVNPWPEYEGSLPAGPEYPSSLVSRLFERRAGYANSFRQSAHAMAGAPLRPRRHGVGPVGGASGRRLALTAHPPARMVRGDCRRTLEGWTPWGPTGRTSWSSTTTAARCWRVPALGRRGRRASPVPCAVTVVDNGSTDGSLAYLAENWPGVAVVREPNRGLASFNAVLGRMSEPVVLLLNNDVKLDRTPSGRCSPR